MISYCTMLFMLLPLRGGLRGDGGIEHGKPASPSLKPTDWHLRPILKLRPFVWESTELTKRAVDSAIRVDNKESGAIWQANAAIEQAAYGNGAEARQSDTEALS